MLPVFLSIRPALLRDADERPVISGSPEHIERGRFRIHFSRTGNDSVEDIDTDTNGLPDLIDEFVAGLIEGEREYALEGWRLLVNDTGGGGSSTIDVYVHAIDAYGYATAIEAANGNEGSSCFIELDEDIQLTGNVARSVAKHELHHCVEFRYTPDAASWLYEAAATYEQYTHATDPVLDYALGLLWNERLAEPERKLSDTAGRFEYAAFLWMKYWSEAQEFEPRSLPDMWETLGAGDPWRSSLERESALRFDQDLGSTYLEHAIWNTFACASDDGKHYLPDILPCITDTTVPLLPWDGTPIEIVHTDGPFAASYLELPSDGEEVSISCSGGPGLRYALVSVDAMGRSLAEASDMGGLPIQIPTAEGGTVRVVVAGTEDTPLSATCMQFDPLSKGFARCSSVSARSTWGMLVVGFSLLLRRRSSPTPLC